MNEERRPPPPVGTRRSLANGAAGSVVAALRWLLPALVVGAIGAALGGWGAGLTAGFAIWFVGVLYSGFGLSG